MPERGEGAGGALTPQYFEDQLILFQPKGADSAYPLLPVPLKFFKVKVLSSGITECNTCKIANGISI